jgi:hypothetical protein
MNSAELLELLKKDKIVDERGIYSRIQISYSDVGKVMRLAVGITTTAGTDGYLGVCGNELVCYEMTLFGAKPSNQVFRLTKEAILEMEMKKGPFGLSHLILVRTADKKYKLVGTLSRRVQLEAIMLAIKK